MSARCNAACLFVALTLVACAATTSVPDGNGSRQALLFEVEEKIFIARTPEQVFAYVADFRRDESWRSEVVDMKTDTGEAPVLGTRTTEIARVLGEDLTTVTEVTVYEPPTRIMARTIAGAPLWLSSERTCEPAGGGTTLRYRVRAENTTLYPTAALAIGYRGIVRGYLEELKDRLEETPE